MEIKDTLMANQAGMPKQKRRKKDRWDNELVKLNISLRPVIEVERIMIEAFSRIPSNEFPMYLKGLLMLGFKQVYNIKKGKEAVTDKNIYDVFFDANDAIAEITGENGYGVNVEEQHSTPVVNAQQVVSPVPQQQIPAQPNAVSPAQLEAMMQQILAMQQAQLQQQIALTGQGVYQAAPQAVAPQAVEPSS
ncbi:hypothetical protein [Lonepinella sp. BR2271]|uniref:hypothetical protein n=1 Tax=Lonepinella sp. BR2271 TaxID=3434550 RepID=UPI003F6DA6F6